MPLAAELYANGGAYPELQSSIQLFIRSLGQGALVSHVVAAQSLGQDRYSSATRRGRCQAQE